MTEEQGKQGAPSPFRNAWNWEGPKGHYASSDPFLGQPSWVEACDIPEIKAIQGWNACLAYLQWALGDEALYLAEETLREAQEPTDGH